MNSNVKFWAAIIGTAILASSCGAVAAASGSDDKPSKSAQPTVTTTVTTTAKPEPAVTITQKAKPAPTVTVTVTQKADTASDDSADSGSGSVYYANCAEVRVAGAAPIHRGEPGYSSDLDRDGDGTACDS
jgi:hypothetical protein